MIWANMASTGGGGGISWSNFGDGPVGVTSPCAVPLECWPYCVGGEESKLDIGDATSRTRAGQSYKERTLQAGATVTGRLSSAGARTGCVQG